MKKVLSILLVSALLAMPFAFSVHAETQKTNACGASDVVRQLLSVYCTYTEAESDDSTQDACAASTLLKKLGELMTRCGDPETGDGNGGCGDTFPPAAPDCEAEDGCPQAPGEKPDTDEERFPMTDFFEKFEEWFGNRAPAEAPDKAPDKEDKKDKEDEEEKGESDSEALLPDDQAAQILELVNAYRTAYGASPVAYDAALSEAAAIRAKETETLFSHTRPDGSRCFTVLSQLGIAYRSAGENIAMGQTTAKEVMTDWMNSDGHRQNILNTSFTKLGIGIHRGADGRLYWAQMFAS